MLSLVSKAPVVQEGPVRHQGILLRQQILIMALAVHPATQAFQKFSLEQANILFLLPRSSFFYGSSTSIFRETVEDATVFNFPATWSATFCL